MIRKIFESHVRHDGRHPPHTKEDESWWRDEIGIMVEHEVWHLPQLAEEQRQD